MNHTTERSLRVSLLLLVGAALLISGCGPENLDDPSYLAQLDESGMIDDASAKKDAMPIKAMDMDDNDMMDDDKAGVDDTIIAGVAAIPTEVVQLPDRVVELPPQVVSEQPLVYNTQEDVNYQQRILHERKIHKLQPTVEDHLIKKNLHTHKQFHTTVINHPSFRKNVGFAQTYSESDEVLPTTEVTEATAVVVGGPVVGAAPFAGARPGCDRWLSGSFYRYCNAYTGTLPVAGPYYR